MEIAKLTSKGQLTLPITIRRQLGLCNGDKVAFIEKDGEFVLVNINRLAVQPIVSNIENNKRSFDSTALQSK